MALALFSLIVYARCGYLKWDLQADLSALGLARDELLPSVSALADDILGVPGGSLVC